MAEGQCCNLLSSTKNNVLRKSLWNIRTPNKGCFTELYFHCFLFIHTPELNSFYKSHLVTISVSIHFSPAPDAELHDMPLYDIIPLKNYSWHLSPVLPQSFLIRQFVTQRCRRFAQPDKTPHVLASSHEHFTFYELTPIQPEWFLFLFLDQMHPRKHTVWNLTLWSWENIQPFFQN